MDPEPYDGTTTDPYAPDPRASQKLAAKKRARQDDRTTNEPRRQGRDVRNHQQLIAGIVGVLAVIGVIAMAISQHGGLQRPAPLAITPEATSAQAFERAQEATPAPTSAPTVRERTIAAYAAPDGSLLGRIATTRQIVPVAHYGTGWVAYQDGKGLVWLRLSDRPDLALAGPDLAPVVAAPQTGRGMVVEQGGGWTPPADTPVPSPLVTEAQRAASAASSEQNELDTMLAGLTDDDRAALTAAAEQHIRRALGKQGP